MSDPLKPSATLLIKLGSMVVHYEELLSSKGHAFDKHALNTLIADEGGKDMVRGDEQNGLPSGEAMTIMREYVTNEERIYGPSKWEIKLSLCIGLLVVLMLVVMA